MSVTVAAEQIAQARATGTGRVGWIDGARGLSIVAMIVSHVDLMLLGGQSGDVVHRVLMRPFAPLFLLLLGMLWRPGLRKRHLQLLGGAVAATALATPLGFEVPNILVLMGACLLVMPWAVRWPVATLAVCVTQLQFWPTPDWWTSYEPGFALALVTAGAVIPSDGIVQGFGRLGSRLGLEVVGRMPLRFYLGHFVALWVLVIVRQTT